VATIATAITAIALDKRGICIKEFLMAADTNVHPMEFQYTPEERLPIEVLTFEMDPGEVAEFLRLDHEIWTLGEAFVDGFDHIPFISKEVWLDDTKPGVVTLVFVWESAESWDRVAATHVQRALQARFDERFGRSLAPVHAIGNESGPHLHRWSRFERLEASLDNPVHHQP